VGIAGLTVKCVRLASLGKLMMMNYERNRLPSGELPTIPFQKRTSTVWDVRLMLNPNLSTVMRVVSNLAQASGVWRPVLTVMIMDVTL
jgi:hypothetical protein